MGGLEEGKPTLPLEVAQEILLDLLAPFVMNEIERIPDGPVGGDALGIEIEAFGIPEGLFIPYGILAIAGGDGTLDTAQLLVFQGKEGLGAADQVMNFLDLASSRFICVFTMGRSSWYLSCSQ